MNEFKSHFNQINESKIKYNEEQIKFIQSKLEDSCLLGIQEEEKPSIIGKIIYHFNIGNIKKNNEFLILSFSRRACHDFIDKGQKQNKKLFNSRNIRHSILWQVKYWSIY